MAKRATKKKVDVTQWFILPCCGPGHHNADQTCGFCGRSHQECADACTESLRVSQTIGPLDCGGSGYWCPNVNCRRFFATDVCGNLDGGTEVSADGKNPILVDEKVVCYCGTHLYNWNDINDDDEE